jgi:hypothetical protein
LQPCDVVIADNLTSQKSANAQTVLKAQAKRILFLPADSPDLNPTEIAYSNSKRI